MYNLLQEQWMPVTRKNGEMPLYLSPSQMTEGLATNPVLAVAAPRPDFNGALLQFLIGLVQTACPPADEAAWQEWFRVPPQPEELAAAFGRYADAFDLDGEGARFMQDRDLVTTESEPNRIDRLLIEMPGEQTLEKNIDLFQKRGTVGTICRSCCAMALFTLQTNAPAGGRGHRTSIRGGGPLTTLVMGRTLWETVWLNVITKEAFSRFGNSEMTGGADIFPWLGRTRTSKKNETTAAWQVHPAQMFWGMPRRIRIRFGSGTDAVPCDLCGRPGRHHASWYSDTSYGTHYKGGWHHILSPYTRDTTTGEMLPRHGQPGGFSYRNRLGFIQECPEKRYCNEPAVVVRVFMEERAPLLAESSTGMFRLFACGYDMENMKARGWYERTLPLDPVDPKLRSGYEAAVSRIIKTADLVLFHTRQSVRMALFAPGVEVSGDLSVIDAEYWQDTEQDFYHLLKRMHRNLLTGQPLTDLNRQWLALLTRESALLFDRYAQPGRIGRAYPARVFRAWHDLERFTSPHSKKIRALLELPDTPGRDERPQEQVIS